MTLDLSTLKIASQALEYVRNLNIEGFTQLIANSFPINKRIMLLEEVRMLRKQTLSISLFDLELDQALLKFEKSVALIEKKRIGNCFEMAVLALDYMINYFPLLNAELYHIVNGDHVFLIIGRDSASDPTNPLQWGDSAYICDPWSDKVYPASVYLQELMNFKKKYDFASSSYINVVEPFNPDKHKLEPVSKHNSAYILQGHAEEHLHEIENLYRQMNNDMLQAVIGLITDFENIAKRLEKKYGKDDDKYLLIESKLESFRFVAHGLRSNSKLENFNLKYRELRIGLETKLKNNFRDYQNSSHFSNTQKNILYKHRNNNFWGQLCRFFVASTKTERELLYAIKKAEDKITLIDENKKQKIR